MKKISIGSSPKCTICINGLSPVHCLIKKGYNGLFTVRNYSNTIGTYVNGNKVETERSFGFIDEIRIGDVSLKSLIWDELNDKPHFASQSTPTCGNTQCTKKTQWQKKRNGFVTFWLWLGIIANVLMIPVGLFKIGSLHNPDGLYLMQLITLNYDVNSVMETLRLHVYLLQGTTVVESLLMIFFYTQLLDWKKNGFWGVTCSSIILNGIGYFLFNAIVKDYSNLFLALSSFSLIPTMIFMLSPIIVLWAILQIKENGISCWKLLE